jgi:predicted amidohydrolase YtcJ
MPSAQVLGSRGSRRGHDARIAGLARSGGGAGADVILVNGKVLTVDETFSVAQALAIAGPRIAAVGSNGAIRALAGPATKVADLGGRTVVPGLWDSHNHQHGRAEMLRDVDLTRVSSIADIQAAVRERAQQVPKGQWIRGSRGWWEYQLSDGRLPTREDLDLATTDHPVTIAGPHYTIANSRALVLSEITRSTPDPQGGEIWKDPATGEPTGLLMDRAGGLLRSRPLPATREERLANLVKMIRRQNGVAVSKVREPGIPPEAVDDYRALLASGQLTQRVDLWYRYAAFQEKTLGSIEPGKDADPTVLSADYMTVPEDRIPSITPVAMLIAGHVIHGTLPPLSPAR